MLGDGRGQDGEGERGVDGRSLGVFCESGKGRGREREELRFVAC